MKNVLILGAVPSGVVIIYTCNLILLVVWNILLLTSVTVKIFTKRL